MANPSGAQTTHPREWVANIKRDLEPFIKTQSSQNTRRPILRVGSRLRETWREHFEPQHISLGLYNRSSSDVNNPKMRHKISRMVQHLGLYHRSSSDGTNPKLTRGNIFRLAVVGAFLAESSMTISDWDIVCEKIVENPNTMFEQYNEEGLDDLSKEDVRSVLSLDAIFLACFLSCFVDIGPDSEFKARFPSIINVVAGESENFQSQLMSDILKLENQIPLVLIQKALLLLFNIIINTRNYQRLQPPDNSRDVEDTRSHVMLQRICTRLAASFGSDLPGWSQAGSHDSEDPMKDNLLFDNKCKHLLHYVYLKLVSEGSDPTGARTPDLSSNEIRLKLLFNSRLSNQEDDPTEDASKFSPLASASQLRKAGINFRGHAGLDVRFQKYPLGATLFLPQIDFLGDNCQTIWRNLLAFEVEHELGNQFVSYLAFMDELIDSEDDVELLRHGKHPVIDNIGVGSNAEVARIFNSITTGYIISSSKNWDRVRKEILDYYKNTYRHLWVEFRTTNIGKPWLFTSFLGAIVLLVFTFLQTLFAILTYKHTF